MWRTWQDGGKGEAKKRKVKIPQKMGECTDVLCSGSLWRRTSNSAGCTHKVPCQSLTSKQDEEARCGELDS